jgi:hypothetical protein
MTEEEFANMSDEEFAEYEASVQDEEVEMEAVDDEEVPEETQPESEAAEPEEEILEDTEPEEEVEVEGEPEEETQEPLDAEAEPEVENTPDSEQDTFDYKAAYEQVMAPIKANGQEMTVKSPEDARKLLQMGFNYDDKMVAIKPVRLAGKALERAGIIRDGVIDEEALNRMIDFNNGNIDVVKARLKELEIDPLDLDLDNVGYQASDHMVDEHSIVLDDIQKELDTRGSTEQVVSALNVMDSGSKEFFSENPQALLGLEQDITNGVFDEIYGNVQYERRMGRLGGKTDMEAYIEFARARGEALREQQSQQAVTPKAPVKKVNTAKRARAGGSKPAPSKTTEAVNPFDLSDEEFERQFGIGQAIR